MDGEQVETLCLEEVTLMVQEVMTNHLRYEEQNNRALSRIALAQVVLLNEMLKALLETDQDFDFMESIYDYIDSETVRYREAREAGDRDAATIMLARVRCAKTLMRRLENPLRQRLLASTPQGDAKPSGGFGAGTGPLAQLIKNGELWHDELMDFNGANPKGLVPQHRLVAYEIRAISIETAENLERVQALGDPAKICLVSGRAQTCVYLMNNWLKLNDWPLFKSLLRELIEEAELCYRQAQENEDRDTALAMLARISTATTLLRRLADPIRSRGLLGKIRASVTFH